MRSKSGCLFLGLCLSLAWMGGRGYGASAGSLWTDPVLAVNSTPVRKIHIQELRNRINSARAAADLPAFSWTDPIIKVNRTKVRRVHFQEMRTALEQVYAAAGRPAPVWTDPILTANATKIRKVHITELRTAVELAPATPRLLAVLRP